MGRDKREPGEERFKIREVATKDLPALFELSAHLNSVNFPSHEATLASAIRRARRSFNQKIEDPFRREYMFVLEGMTSGRIAGTSMLFAQHGHREEPHTFFDVITDERYSSTLDRHFEHIYLRLGFSYNGPTETGGLVLDPAMRGMGLGKLLSFVRFLFIAMYRRRFRDTVIAELMPPLTKDGRSVLWDHLGRKFTGLDYQEADKLSRTNKEFIVSLFPHGPVNASLLPTHVQKMIGQVGQATLGVRKMLESIGFEYAHRIDPFDGGPHLEAKTNDITLIRGSRRWEVEREPLDRSKEQRSRVLVGRGRAEGATRFSAVAAEIRGLGARVRIDEATREALKVRPGDLVWTVPL